MTKSNRFFADVSFFRVATSALLIGGLLFLGFGLMAPGGIDIFDNPGSAADWTAAVGTWIIGIGAIRFAASDHSLKLHERREKRLKEAKEERARFWAIAYWGTSMTTTLLIMKERLKSTAEMEPASVQKNVLVPVAEAIVSIRWGADEESVVSEESARNAARLHHELGEIRSLIGQNDTFLRHGVVSLDDKHGSLILEEIRYFADRAEASLDRLQGSLLEDAKGVLRLIESLEERLEKEDRELTGD
ncbi:hypothetical protein [Stenotrophomonas nematodicola]|uniref:Transmembrane protein n=1 Tax=Stenotrophomonas nematodicola TaxID=2656746 RepID=A0ABW7CUR5_9GAMM